ncbi:TetR family transcriptional regulator [Kribbella shirazensis]|jgi:AcrR family transcriptional regulator|uniref:AcrR family transcriptional regulator n=1 Tax=Kribbella shirazensis TaxID=1105143 RepID=A0A7X5ZYS2_9ACTN|nr:TetR family transcriptional regulator [Kribbella shirazensis]NIK55416.1 AcrR family transcriptional regulator [Kribbella shirazensis]
MAEKKSDRTRAAILAAARERFGADGYERATIRAIAADAAIDPAMVMRYYGNKEKLFAAAADFDVRMPELRDVPKERLGEVLVRHLIERWEEDDTLRVLLRTAVTNEAAAERMRALFIGQLTPAFQQAAIDRPDVRAGLIATQALGFALCRYILQLRPVVDLSTDEAVAWLGPTVNRYLTEPSPNQE